MIIIWWLTRYEITMFESPLIAQSSNHQIIQLSVLQTCPGCRGIRAGACVAKIPAHRYPWLQVTTGGVGFTRFQWAYFPGFSMIWWCLLTRGYCNMFHEWIWMVTVLRDLYGSTYIPQLTVKLSLHLSSRLGSDGWQDSALHAHHMSNTLFSYPLVI